MALQSLTSTIHKASGVGEVEEEALKVEGLGTVIEEEGEVEEEVTVEAAPAIQASTAPGPAPAVPGFGPPLPSKPAPLPSQGPSNPKKKKKSHNQLGLTPRTESHEESEDEDVDEEATFAATGPELKFEYRGQTSTLGSSADIAAWIEERRKRFPTKQRIEERKEEARKRIDQRKEAQQAQQRAHNQELQRKRKERKIRVEQNDNEQRKKAIEKHLIKAEKLRRKLKKSEEKAARAAMSLGLPSSLEGGADTVKLDGHGSPWTKLEGDQDQGLPVVDEGQLQNPSSLNIDTEGAHIMSIKPEFNEDLFSSLAWNLDEAITRTSSTFRFSSFLPPPLAPSLFDDDGGSSDMSISSSSEDPSSESDDSSDDEAPEEASSRRDGPTRVPPPVRERGICKFFLRTGRCRMGARCHFRHELPERSTKSIAIKDQGKDKSKRTEAKRKTLHQRLVEQEEEEENRLALQVIKQLGDNGFFEEDELNAKAKRGKDITIRAAMMILLLRKKGDISDETWASLTRLESHVDDIVRRDLLETMAHGAHQFSATQNDFSEETVVEMFARILCNSLTLVTPMYDPVGIAFDPLASISNHSCDPNAVVVFDGPRLSFRSLKSIAKDEEVFTAYVDTTNPFPYRHHELRNRFHFNCHCSKCMEAPTEPEDLFLQDPSKLPKTEPYVTFSATDVGRVLFQNTEWANGPQFAIGTDLDSRRLAGIQGYAFHNLEVAKDESDPYTAIKMLEDTIKLCFHSGMWPITRQPMPNLRQQLFVNMLSINNFIIAWCQGVNIYLLIDPYLYPQEFHPVRVVHAWTLVLLTLYVSGQQDDPAVQQMHGQGVDFGIIILGLLNHVSNNVENSHGKGSSFAETVQMRVPSILSDVFPQGPPPMAALNAALEQQWKCLSQMAMWLKV
ncbi:hypothetical protein B0A49_07060 [Cryomyces minteri]|uniref:C3H1-type domain-containing protein n=1 Tax=Cryomyces minteri TaxID=331657 RepID=A0A4U0WR63_9PEZI|nr:hypothetical protein B0A49_07060 [Cryomyces minteri]